jgi:hypothetical protein
MERSAAFALAGCILFVSTVLAQEPSRGPDGGTSSHVSGVEVLAIPGKPFSAKDTIDWVRTLEDGSTVTLQLDAFLARDSHGRVYRERHRFVPAGSKDRSPLYEIHLFDPVTRTQLLCNGRTFRCVLSNYTPQTFFDATPEGVYDHGTRTLTREHLGADTIEGFYTVGTRETMTTKAGAVGNERPIVSTREFWYSDELQTNLSVTRIDPVEGKQVIRLSAISQSEPDEHLWDIPIGFTVRDMRASTRRER